MIISWKQSFKAQWKLNGKTGMAKYDVTVELEGRPRPLMTDAAPIIATIASLDSKNLSEICGRSSLEAVVIHIQKLIEPKLEGGDKLKRLFVWEDDMFGAEV